MMGYLDSNGLARVWSKIKSALAGKQDSLAGTKGQVLGFNEQGLPVAEEPTITANDAKQLKADMDFLFALSVINDKLVTDVPAMARKYYPVYWDKQRIDGLVFVQRLTQEEADAITGTTTDTTE